MHDFSGMADAGGMGYPPSPLIGPWPRVFGCGAGVLNGKPPPQTSVRTLGGGSTSLQGPRAIISLSDARLAYLIKGAKMLRTKHLKMAVVPMTLLALLSTAVPVASAQETTDESFYELTTTPSGGDMIVGEPGTTILFDSSNGELVDVLPPSEAEDYSVTVSRGCADSNAGCWAGGNALGDMQFAGTGTATGSWPYRNSYTTGNKSGQITFAINGVTYTVAS